MPSFVECKKIFGFSKWNESNTECVHNSLQHLVI